MLTSKDKGQKFSGQGNAANRVSPRKNGPAGGGTSDQDESVELNPIDQDATDLNALIGRRQTDVETNFGDRSIGEGDQPYRRPADAPKNNTDPLVMWPTDPEFGRMAPALSINRWEGQVSNPGRTGPLDPDTLNPKRPAWSVPSADTYDVSGKGEGQTAGTAASGGQPGQHESE